MLISALKLAQYGIIFTSTLADISVYIVLLFFDRLFEEIMFKLPDDNGRALGESVEDLTHEPLRFAVHPMGDRPMIAMATVNYGDLKIKVCQLRFSSFL